MSDDLSAIHAQISAILEKLYDEKGQPEELESDASFTHEFFKLVSEQVKFDGKADKSASSGPHLSDAKFAHQNKGLVEVKIPSAKFQVSELRTAESLKGMSYGVGSFGIGTPGRYLIATVKKSKIKFTCITIKAGESVVIFMGFAGAAQNEAGRGQWVKN